MESITKMAIIILRISSVEMGWVMVVRIGVKRTVVGKMEIGMKDFFSNSVVLRIVSLGVEGVTLVILAMLDMMSLTAGIGFMIMDKMNLEMSKVQMRSKDNISSNL